MVSNPNIVLAYVSVTPWQDSGAAGGEDDKSQEDNERSGGSMLICKSQVEDWKDNAIIPSFFSDI